LLRGHARRGTAHAALIAEILGLLAGNQPSPPRGEAARLHEPLSRTETRVLRFLPTNLSAPEIAGQLSVSVNTIRTHMRHVYEKLGAHSRTEAVEQASNLGLLVLSSRRPLPGTPPRVPREPFIRHATVYRARLMLAKSPMNPEATPTPITGMIRPQ
jgi:DNA-binding CsgD family transcriptional regulator